MTADEMVEELRARAKAWRVAEVSALMDRSEIEARECRLRAIVLEEVIQACAVEEKSYEGR